MVRQTVSKKKQKKRITLRKKNKSQSPLNLVFGGLPTDPAVVEVKPTEHAVTEVKPTEQAVVEVKPIEPAVVEAKPTDKNQPNEVSEFPSNTYAVSFIRMSNGSISERMVMKNGKQIHADKEFSKLRFTLDDLQKIQQKYNIPMELTNGIDDYGSATGQGMTSDMEEEARRQLEENKEHPMYKRHYLIENFRKDSEKKYIEFIRRFITKDYSTMTNDQFIQNINNYMFSFIDDPNNYTDPEYQRDAQYKQTKKNEITIRLNKIKINNDFFDELYAITVDFIFTTGDTIFSKEFKEEYIKGFINSTDAATKAANANNANNDLVTVCQKGIYESFLTTLIDIIKQNFCFEPANAKCTDNFKELIKIFDVIQESKILLEKTKITEELQTWKDLPDTQSKFKDYIATKKINFDDMNETQMDEINNDISEMFKTYMYTKFNIQNDKESETNINTFITEQKSEQKSANIFYDILEPE